MANRKSVFAGFYFPLAISALALDPASQHEPAAGTSSCTTPFAKTIRNLRETLEALTNFGDGGHQPGQLYGVKSIATDSKGNLYTTETYEDKRVQRFIYKDIGPVRRGSQGVVWPGRG